MLGVSHMQKLSMHKRMDDDDGETNESRSRRGIIIYAYTPILSFGILRRPHGRLQMSALRLLEVFVLEYFVFANGHLLLRGERQMGRITESREEVGIL